MGWLLRIGLTAVVLAGCAGSGATSPGLVSTSPSGLASVPAASPPGSSPPGTPGDPAAAPMPAGFPVHRSMQPEEPETRFTPSWSATASGAVLYAFYLRELVEAGFVIGLEAPGGEAAVIRFAAADGTAYQLDLLGGRPAEVHLGPPHP